tara:strand:- start:4097 stop:4669 length:573 start_codon:yes stop_codon:yes gene_type:complete
MRVLPFDQDMVDRAKEWAESIGSLNRSIISGEGNFAGRIGELALAHYLGVEVEDHKDYDLIYKGDKIEVKTKRRSCAPLPDYDVSVAKTSGHQKADRYIFISLQFSEKKFCGKPYAGKGRVGGAIYNGLEFVWLCGDMDVKEYFLKAKLWRKGDKDKSNNFHTQADMYNMKIKDLNETYNWYIRTAEIES